jgi:hypothetical protein
LNPATLPTLHLARRQQVVGNTGSNSTGEALHATEQGFAVGMHAALQINPYYGKTSTRGLRAHFDAVLKVGSRGWNRALPPCVASHCIALHCCLATAVCPDLTDCKSPTHIHCCCCCCCCC